MGQGPSPGSITIHRKPLAQGIRGGCADCSLSAVVVLLLLHWCSTQSEQGQVLGEIHGSTRDKYSYGVGLLVAGCWLLVAGCWLLAGAHCCTISFLWYPPPPPPPAAAPHGHVAACPIIVSDGAPGHARNYFTPSSILAASSTCWHCRD